ncbi:host attachment family protein [Cognatilysobacter bugurensis]|uniref:Attachment protein n=1 Tax=Cognatilysobacter bugurensis TaxID=543356 RepID=A0A918SWC9_9GAMM|nr:host attachment family protein [Lysobacter bugurensis]GHA73954.1 attachment protein [Lysobacter bugurensis]
MQSIPSGAWVVVADGGGARMLQNVGEAKAIKLIQQRLIEPQNLDGEGPSGSQPKEVDVEEATFAKQLANRLNDGALKNDYRHLVLIADPQTLGQVRPLLHKETLERLIGEMAKTLTNASIADIERVLH